MRGRIDAGLKAPGKKPKALGTRHRALVKSRAAARAIRRPRAPRHSAWGVIAMDVAKGIAVIGGAFGMEAGGVEFGRVRSRGNPCRGLPSPGHPTLKGTAERG
jgi:hypothetical protein